MASNAAVYCRISLDRAGAGLGVQRQEALCRELATSKGWTIAETYVDNDVSAYSGRKRPSYERMLADLDAGSRDAVLVVDVDRLTRTPAELERFIDLCDRQRVALANVSGDLDLATSDGRFRARIMGAVARQESEKKSDRLKREREQSARAGKPHGGPRPFGYERDGLTVRAEEAALVREAASRILAGESLRSLAADWQGRGIAGPQSGRPFAAAALKGVLTNPRIAGLRRHRPRGRDGKPTSEELYPAQWSGIIDRDTFERLAAKLDHGPASRTGRPAVHLLAGVALCGRCGARLYVSYRQGTRRYSCRPEPGRDGCGRLAVNGKALDAEVTGQVLAALSGPGLAAALASGDGDDGGLGDELAAAEDRLEALAADYADGLITRREWLAARERLTDRIDALKRTLAAAAGKSVLGSLPTSEVALRAAWEAGSIEWRRAVLAAVVEEVTVRPTASRGRFDPARVALRWRV